MCSLTVYRNLMTPTWGQLSGEQLSDQFRSVVSLLDTLLAHGTLEFERDHNWLRNLRELCLDRVASLTQPSGYGNAEYLCECKSDLRHLKETLRHLFARYHSTYRLNPVLWDVHSLAYGQAWTAEEALFRRAGYDVSHFTLLREYSDLLDLLTPALRCGCFANASFNRVDPTTGLPLDLLRLAEALERLPGFQAPPLHLPLLFGPQPHTFSPLDAELVNDLRLVCSVLRLDFDAVTHQLVTYAVALRGHPHNPPSQTLRTADFELLARHTVTSLRLLRQFEDAQQESDDVHLLVGNDVARAVVRTQVAWFERLWEDEHGNLRFTLTQLARDVQLRARDGLRLDWGRIAPLFGWAEEVRWVDETQDERWVTWLRNSEPQQGLPLYEASDSDSDNEGDGEDGNDGNDEDDDGDDDNTGDALRPRHVQATDRFPRARRNAVVAGLPGALHLTRTEFLDRSLRVGTQLFVSAEHFVYTRMVNQLLAAMRSLRAEPNPARARLLDADTRSRILGRVAQLPSLDLPPPAEHLHPVHAHLWDALRALFVHASLSPEPLVPSLQRELERLSDLLVAAWEEPALLPEHFTSRTGALDGADSVAGVQWLVVLFAATDNLDAAQANDLAGFFTAHLAANATHPAFGSTPEERSESSFARWRTLDLPHWVALLRDLAEEDEQAQLAAHEAEYRAVAAAATRDQHAALLSALPRSLHPSVHFLHPDTLTHANSNPQYDFLLDLLSVLRREQDELRQSDPESAHVAVLETQRQAYATALLDIVRAKASRREAPEFGPVTAAESVPFLFALPGGADGLLPFTALAGPDATVDQ
jgi:hypothetical protein